ncbi:MAG TPA: ribose 5-phosphate isomerase B [Nannocystaceae bacterium]|nr:ribose 5-phosphate isomerase B [Nannocystaceae bacterium]
MTTLFFGSDHAGVELRRGLVIAATELGHDVAGEVGPTEASMSVDYPDIAAQVGASVLAAPGSYGVIVCGTGQGVAMAANGIAGIRAAVVSDCYSAKMARAHNDANVLCMGARVVGSGLARELLEAFLGTAFAGGRHAGRVAKVDALRRKPTS